MPLHRAGNGKHWVVQHKDGRLMGRFTTRKAALRQLKAIGAKEDAERKKKARKKSRR